MNNGSNFDIRNMNNMLNLVKLLSSAPGNPQPPTTSPQIELDNLVSDEKMNMIKASLPYLDVNKQKSLAIIIKYLELSKTMTLYSQYNPQDIPDMQKSNASKRDLLYTLRSYCSDKNKQMIDIVLNIRNMKHMMTTLKNPDTMYQNPYAQGSPQNNPSDSSSQDENLNQDELIQKLKHLMQN